MVQQLLEELVSLEQHLMANEIQLLNRRWSPSPLKTKTSLLRVTRARHSSSGIVKNCFEQHRDRQYHRNRQRIMEIKQINDECREEIMASDSADYEAGDEDGGRDGYQR